MGRTDAGQGFLGCFGHHDLLRDSPVRVDVEAGRVSAGKGRGVCVGVRGRNRGRRRSKNRRRRRSSSRDGVLCRG